MEEFKIRASAVGKILGAKGLGETGKTYINEWLKWKIWGRKEIVTSKYFDKGNINEDDGITLLTLSRKLGMIYKNADYFENEWCTGTPDIIDKDIVYDIKNSYSLKTFPMFYTGNDLKDYNKDYYYQLQVYMWLTKLKKSVLAYVLTDLPNDMLWNEIKYLNDVNERQEKAKNFIFTKKAWDKAKEDHFPLAEETEFIEIPENKRIRTFDVNFDPNILTVIPERVKECRNIIKQLLLNN